MEFRIWHSDPMLARWVEENTVLSLLRSSHSVVHEDLTPSDAAVSGKFFKTPARIRDILYLDCPDVIIECDRRPIASIEISQEAGTGHNAFQRFARVAAAVENGVPAFYVYPEAVLVRRVDRTGWDELNPLVFRTLDELMSIYSVPALLYYFPSQFTRFGAANVPAPPSKGLIYDPDPRFAGQPDSGDSEMVEMFDALNQLVDMARAHGPSSIRDRAMLQLWARQRRQEMVRRSARRLTGTTWSPETATMEVPTHKLLHYLRRFAGAGHAFGHLLEDRPRTVVYQANAKFRGDPYTGSLAAIDYLKCRNGPTYEDREKNLVFCWGVCTETDDGLDVVGSTSVDDFVESVRSLYSSPGRVLLDKSFSQLKGDQIPRYMFQVRFGTAFTKKKELRIFSYFADAMLFGDGALWREG